MLKIGDFSKLSRVSIRMLRYYDNIGLLKPIEIDPYTGYRYYSENQLPACGRITALKDMGFGLAAIGEIIDCYDDKELLARHLRMKQAELAELQEQIEYRMRLLDTALERLRKDDKAMKYDVNLKTFPKRYAATVRMTIPSYGEEGMLWSTLMSETVGMNLIADDPCYCCAVFHDKEFKETDVDVEVQKTVKGRYDDTEHVIFSELPEVTVASAICRGSYSQMSEVNAVVAQWVSDNGYTYEGSMFNIYHVSPHETTDPNEFITEVCYPVRKK